MRASDIVNKSDQKSISRSKRLTAKLYKVEDNRILYTVTSSKGNNQYLVTLLLLGLTGNRLRSLKDAIKGDIKISCTCPAFLYKGYKYITYKRQVGLNKETRPPVKTNPNQEGMACKHIVAALEQLKLDYTSIYNLFKSAQPKESPADRLNNMKYNYKSTEPTDYDLSIAEDFHTACFIVYDDYMKFLNSNPSENEKFVDSKFYDGTDPSKYLKLFSKPVSKSIAGKFMSKCKSLDAILDLIDQKKNGFNVLIDSDIQSLTKKINSVLKNTNESFINDIILSIIYD